MNASKVIDETLYFFRDNCVYLSIIIIPISLVWLGFNYASSYLFDDNAWKVADFLLFFLFYSILYAVEILTIDKRAKAKPFRISEVFRESLSYWFPLFKLLFIKSLLIGVGLFLFIVPGIFLFVRLALAEQYLILKDSDAVTALKQSYSISTPYFITILVSVGGFFAFFELINYFVEKLEDDIPQLLNALISLVGIVFTSLPTIAAYRIYTMIEEQSTQNT